MKAGARTVVFLILACCCQSGRSLVPETEVKPRYYPVVLLTQGSREDIRKELEWRNKQTWFSWPFGNHRRENVSDIGKTVAEMRKHVGITESTGASVVEVQTSPYLWSVESASIIAKEIGAESVWVNTKLTAKPSTTDACLNRNIADLNETTNAKLNETGETGNRQQRVAADCELFTVSRYVSCDAMAERSIFLSDVDVNCGEFMGDSMPLLPQFACSGHHTHAELCDAQWATHVSAIVLQLLNDAIVNGKTVLVVTHKEVIREVASRLLKSNAEKVQVNAWLTIPDASKQPLRSGGIEWKLGTGDSGIVKREL